MEKLWNCQETVVYLIQVHIEFTSDIVQNEYCF